MQLSSSQKRGILVLFVILLVLAGIRLRSVYLSKSPQLPPQDSTEASKANEKIDLNAATEAELEKLPGIGQVLAARIVKFRKSIGGFASVDELAKVYGLKPETFEQIKPLVFAGPYKKQVTENTPGNFERPDKNNFESKADSVEVKGRPQEVGNDKPPKGNHRVDLNAADSLALVKINGIGAYTAGKILSRRRGLGFFHSVEQLKEIWGISPENYEKIKDHLFVGEDLSFYPHLKINQATFAELKVHPYLGYKPAQLITTYKAEHGNYKSIADLKKIYGIDAKTWDKLMPYLEF